MCLCCRRWSCVWGAAGAGLSSSGDMEIKWPASEPRRPVAASATPSRLLKGDTIPINVFLSTLLRCLFNTAPGGFRAGTARVKLHFTELRERCDKRRSRSGTVREHLPASHFVLCFISACLSKAKPGWTELQRPALTFCLSVGKGKPSSPCGKKKWPKAVPSCKYCNLSRS